MLLEEHNHTVKAEHNTDLIQYENSIIIDRFSGYVIRVISQFHGYVYFFTSSKE